MAGLPGIGARDITGVILAGGRGSRLGGVDKGLVRLHGRPLVEHAIESLRPQVGGLLISANRNRAAYAAYGFPVIADVVGDYDGPLAGMLSAMRTAGTTYVAVVPCDVPQPPADLVERLAAAINGASADAAVVTCGGSMQPVFALLRCALAGHLESYLAGGGRGAGEWMREQGAVTVDFSGRDAEFAGVNTPEELRCLEQAAPGPG